MQNVPLLEKIQQRFEYRRMKKQFLRRIYDSGACAIAFEGGEPLLRKDLKRKFLLSLDLCLCKLAWLLMELFLNPK